MNAPVAKGEVAPKTHTLFMGADFSIGQDDVLYPVLDVMGSSWVIEINGRTTVISSKGGPTDIKITPLLKITEVAATIGDLKSVRGYTFDNDPSVRFTRGQSQVAVTTVENQASRNQMMAQNDEAMAASQMAANGHQVAHQVTADGRNKQVVKVLLDAEQNENASVAQVNDGAAVGGRKLGSDGLDAMDVQFELSSPKPLQNPYVITITRFHAVRAKPGSVQNLVYARSLAPTDSTPTNVHFVEGGFPPDFELLSFQMHLYNRGSEVSTNIAPNRVDLTRDEAFEYVKLDYVNARKGETVPATPVMGELPSDLPNLLAQGKYVATFFVHVSKDGLADAPFADAVCTRRIEDLFLQAVVKSLRFKPALSGGKPVDGIAPVNLKQLGFS